jgi:signal recognition particle GTPase
MSSFEVACHSLNEVANKLRQEHQRTAVGVCGLGGSGKSTICRKVAETANFKCTVFELDWYLTHSSWGRRSAILQSLTGAQADIDFWKDPTNWYDWSTFEADLKQLSDPDPKLLIGELSTELPTAGACLAGIFEYPPHAPTMDNSTWYFMLPPVV